MKEKQAYLIVAHKDDLVFQTLLEMLDDPRNDIFIHMDAKNKDYQQEKTEGRAKFGRVYHCDRTSVTWGAYSMIHCELSLLEQAVQTGNYQHYHLLSGSDLPIKSQDDIVSFFEQHADKEFVRFERESFGYDFRVRYYHLFQEKTGRSHNVLVRGVNRGFILVQQMAGIKRNHRIDFQKGTQWFSITDELARYLVSKKDWVYRVFKDTFCCDEVFVQTIVYNSGFKDRLYHEEFDNDPEAVKRLIDWTRGKPYTFRSCDWDELKNSGMLFARKFDEKVDKEIIMQIKEAYSSTGKQKNMG